MQNNPYEVVQVDAGSYRIEENGVRSMLFIGEGEALLVDTGFGTGDLKAVVASLTDLPIRLVVTHADRDHIGCNAQFGPAYMHPAEYDRYHQGGGAALEAKPLWEGDVIDIGTRQFEVVLIPGHTPGSIALLDRANRVLIAGDSVQAGHIFMFGPGRNLPAYIASMNKLLVMSDLYDTVYPSHADFPVSKDIIPKLIAGGQKLLAGEIAGQKPAREGIEALAYPVGVATFLY